MRLISEVVVHHPDRGAEDQDQDLEGAPGQGADLVPEKDPDLNIEDQGQGHAKDQPPGRGARDQGQDLGRDPDPAQEKGHDLGKDPDLERGQGRDHQEEGESQDQDQSAGQGQRAKIGRKGLGAVPNENQDPQGGKDQYQGQSLKLK